MEQGQNSARQAGKPHALTLCLPLLLLPWGGAAVWWTYGKKENTALSAAVGGAVLLVTAALLGLAAVRHAVNRWRVEDGVLYMVSGFTRRRERGIRLDRLLYAELCQRPWHVPFRCARVKLYVPTQRGAVFSLLMGRQEAAALVNCVAAGEHGDGGTGRKYLSGGRYAALLGAAVSRGTLLPLSGAALCLVLGRPAEEMRILAAALLLAGLLHMTARLLSEGTLSVCIVSGGFAVKMGVGGSRRLFVPRRAVVGVLERANAVALLCGASRFELVCEGGRRIPCMRWYTGGSGAQAAARLLECSGEGRTQACDSRAFRTYYMRLAVAAIFGGVAIWFGLRSLEPPLRAWGMAAGAAVLTGAWLHCLTAVRFGRESGMVITSGALRIGGMRFLSAQRLTVRRGCLAAVRLRRSLPDRAGGTCTAELLPKGSRRGCLCRQVPYDKLLAVVERFC